MTSNTPTLKLLSHRDVSVDRDRALAWAFAALLLVGTVVGTYALAPWNEPSLPLLGAVGIAGIVLTTRLILWWMYKPVSPRTHDGERVPSLTVVIPAYNEEKLIGSCLTSVVEADYPDDRLRVIVVNDGSTDSTAKVIERIVARYPGRIEAIHLNRNQGKRHALFRGFESCESELVATVDSDSILPPETLRNLVAPFQQRARVGAVAGRVMVRNRKENLITRMLAVRYILGFDFIRAYQSMLNTVWCCPGALQAYRREVIAPHLETWRDQTFLGAACTNGDDHAMTNLVLEQGYDSVYQSNATVLTQVPRTYRKLTRMYTRWGRSATREGLRALQFAPRRAFEMGPFRGSLMLLDAISQPLTVLLRLIGFVALGWLLIAHPWLILSAVTMTGWVALLYSAIYLKSERSSEVVYGFIYAFFALLTLPWVQPFATLTVRQNGWLTRGPT